MNSKGPLRSLVDDPLHLNARRGQLLLATLILFFAAWDLRAVLPDRRLSPTDTTVEDALFLRQALGPEGSGIWPWLAEIRKGPLAAPLVALADVAVGDPLLAGRLVNVALHGALLWLVCLITVRLTGGGRREVGGGRQEAEYRRGSWGAGLCATVICGTFPMVYGWFRLDYHEPLVAVILLWCLHLMLIQRQPRRSTALLLGLALGLGILAKLSFTMFVMAPLALYAVCCARDHTGLRRLGLAVLVALLLTGWWLLPNAAHLLSYLSLSHQRIHETPAARLVIYTWGIHGSALLLGSAALGSVVAWRLRVAGGPALLLLGSSLVGALAWLVLLFDSWPRYLVPVFPVASVLCALGLWGAARRATLRLGRRVVRGGLGCVLAALLINFCVDNVRGLPLSDNGREGGVGLIVADRRPHNAYPRAVAALRRLGGPVVELPGWPQMLGKRPVAQSLVWQRRGLRLPRASGTQLVERLSRGRPVHLVFCHETGGDVLSLLARAKPSDHVDAATLALLMPKKKRVLQTLTDPNDVSFSVIRILP